MRRSHSGNTFNNRDQRGFSLVESVVAIGVSGIIVLGASQLITDVDHQTTGAEKTFWISARRAEIQNTIRNEIVATPPVGWAAIIAANPDLGCINAAGGCGAFTALQPLKIPMDGTFLDGASATQGISNRGDLCNTFDSVSGNLACPIGILAKWQALCDGPSCIRAQPKIVVQFSEKVPGGPLKQLTNFDLTVFKDAKLENLNNACVALGGTPGGVPLGTTCALPALAAQCDPPNGSFALGFDSLGKVVCGKPLIDSCLSTDVAVGFRADGGIACAPACQ